MPQTQQLDDALLECIKHGGSPNAVLIRNETDGGVIIEVPEVELEATRRVLQDIQMNSDYEYPVELLTR